jgi:putative zinc finger/helix-turn-helix YgiT family protein
MMSETMYCPMCEEDRPCRREIRREEYDVRGDRITLDVPRLICATCGEAGIDESFGDPTLRLYAEYRRSHRLLSPEQIRAIRERYDLSQEAFASLLGTSPATLARYEGGSLQDKAYDHLLRACENPVFVADLVEREGSELSPRQLRDVQAALRRIQPRQAKSA